MATKKTSRTAQGAGAAKESKLPTGKSAKQRKNKKRLNKACLDQSFMDEFNKAIDLANGGSHEEAIPCIDGIFARYSKIPKTFRSYLFYLKGFTLFHSKRDNRRALKCFNLAINCYNKPEGVCYYDRGLLKEELGDMAGRDADFAMFVKIRPDLADWVKDRNQPNTSQGAK